jgi:hypothetical protein
VKIIALAVACDGYGVASHHESFIVKRLADISEVLKAI